MKNLFNTNIINANSNFIKKNAEKKTHMSRNPNKTGIIPKQYNRKRNHSNSDSDSEFSDYEDFNNNNKINSDSDDGNNNNLLFNKSKKIIDNRKHERAFVEKTKDDDNYLEQFKPMKFTNLGEPVSSNAVHYGSDNHSSVVDRMETERELALKGNFSNFGESNDMTYGIMSPDNFTHNNMKPFFKSRGLNNRKSEQSATVHQRRMESFSGTLNDERPDWRHKKEQAPLFSPVTSISNPFGMPVMTDAYEGRFIPGRERRNEPLFEPIRVGPGLGVGLGENGDFIKGAGDLYRPKVLTVDDLRAKNNPKVTYGGVIVEGQKGEKRGINGRQVVQKRGASARFKEQSPKEDFLAKFTGEVTGPKIIGAVDPNSMGGVNRGVQETNHIGPSKFNVDQITDTKMRDGKGDKYRTPFKQSFDQSEAPGFYLYEGLKGQSNYDSYITDATQRGKEQDYIAPIGKSENFKNTVFNPNDIPDITMREIHSEKDRSGHALTGNYKQRQSYDPNDIPDITMREIHSEKDRTGNALTGNYKQRQAYDPNDIPDITMREIHGEKDRTGNAISGDKYIIKSFNPNDIPDISMREIHSEKDRSGNAISGDYFKSKSIDFSDVPNVTLREINSELDWIGPNKKYIGEPNTRNDAYNSKVNVTREVIAQGRNPNGLKNIITPSNQFTKYKLKETTDINYLNHPHPEIPQNNNIIFEMVNDKDPTWWFNNRTDDYPEKNLAKNPYINNTVHKAIPIDFN